jgi:hypothetical protein
MADQGAAEARKEHAALLQERAWFDPWYRDLSDYFQPRRSRFLSSDANRPKRNTKNARNRALLAVRVARAGLAGGLTPRTRPWFSLTVGDPDLAEYGPVKEWLYRQQIRMFERIARTNFYDAVHETFGDDVVFGTSSLNVEDDDLDVSRCYVAPVGSFVVANNDRLEVDTWYHRTTMSVRNLVNKFGLENCSDQVKTLYDAKNNMHAPIEIVHAVTPRKGREYGDYSIKNAPYSSCWFETAGQEDKYLRESGYREFPIMCSRWDKTGEDAYGVPPAADALGAAMGLQVFEKARTQALQLAVRPPMNAPSTLRDNGGTTILPGQTNYYDPSGPHAKIEPAIIVNERMFVEAREELHDIESQIENALMVDLFLLIANEERSGVTAEEIRGKKEERLLQVGPTIQRMEREKLKPYVDRQFGIMLRRGEIEPPPPELSGQNLGVEFIGPLSAAQRLVATDSIETTSRYVKEMAEVTPAILDGFDQDVALAEYGKARGVPPNLIRDKKTIAAIREDQAKQKQMEQLAAMAKPAKDAAVAMQVGAETQPVPGNPLERIGQALQQGARA